MAVVAADRCPPQTPNEPIHSRDVTLAAKRGHNGLEQVARVLCECKEDSEVEAEGDSNMDEAEAGKKLEQVESGGQDA